MQKVKKVIKYLVIGFVALMVLGMFMGGGDDAVEQKASNQAPAVQETTRAEEVAVEEVVEEVVIVEATAEELLDAFDANEIRANSVYKDQVIELTGIISDISHSDIGKGSYTLSIGSGKDFEFVDIKIKATMDFEDQLINLDKGNEVVVRFKCKGLIVGLYVEGELIEVL